MFSFSNQAEVFCIELNRRKQIWLIFCCYNPHKHILKNNLQQIENGINSYSKTYKNFTLKEDFNAEISDNSMGSFCVIH